MTRLSVIENRMAYTALDERDFGKQRVVWGSLMAAMAAVLLAAGGLSSLQTASLVAALPFTVLLLLMMVALMRLLRREPLPVRAVDLQHHRMLAEAARQERSPDHAPGRKGDPHHGSGGS